MTLVSGRIEMGLGGSCIRNLGFEQGFDFWTKGTIYDSINVISGDSFVGSAWEGSKMLRIGTPQSSAGPSQPIGLTSLYQDIILCEPTIKVAFRMFTWDYTSFDLFRCTVTDLDTGVVLFSFTRGGWGENPAAPVKDSGWRYLPINVSNHLGKRARLRYAAGGTQDTLYATWVYIDSAVSSTPSQSAYGPYSPPPY